MVAQKSLGTSKGLLLGCFLLRDLGLCLDRRKLGLLALNVERLGLNSLFLLLKTHQTGERVDPLRRVDVDVLRYRLAEIGNFRSPLAASRRTDEAAAVRVHRWLISLPACSAVLIRSEVREGNPCTSNRVRRPDDSSSNRPSSCGGSLSRADAE